MYIEADLPDPNHEDFAPNAVETLKKYLLKTQGSAFIFFTSYSMLTDFADRLEDWLRENDMPLLRQDAGIDRQVLLDGLGFSYEIHAMDTGPDGQLWGIATRHDADLSDAADPGNVTVDTHLYLVAIDPTDGTVVRNQADLLNTVKPADSDDPNINGQADPNVAGDEDPTQVVVALPPIDPLLKENTQATASVGERFGYRITIPAYLGAWAARFLPASWIDLMMVAKVKKRYG